MNHSPLVSVAICIYNGESFLKEQLNSILNQSYPNLEVIAVDDNSSDQSVAILNDYASQYPNIKVYRNISNMGYVKNFEKAISLSTGKYIALSDHDDIWHPEKISMQIEAIGDHLLVYHDSEYIDDKGDSLNIKMSDLLNLYEGDSPLPFVLKNSVSGHTILFDRKIIPYALPFNPIFFHDWWLVFVAANLGSIKMLPIALVKYRQHLNNTVDLLNRKETTVQETSIHNPLTSDKDWIKHCGTFDGPYKAYITKLHKFITLSESSFITRIKLYLLIFKKKKLLLAINKGSKKYKTKMLKNWIFNPNKI